jgi:hypothetical protein
MSAVPAAAPAGGSRGYLVDTRADSDEMNRSAVGDDRALECNAPPPDFQRLCIAQSKFREISVIP